MHTACQSWAPFSLAFGEAQAKSLRPLAGGRKTCSSINTVDPGRHPPVGNRVLPELLKMLER